MVAKQAGTAGFVRQYDAAFRHPWPVWSAALLVAATNVFVHDGEDWRLVNHHGSPVASHARDLG